MAERVTAAPRALVGLALALVAAWLLANPLTPDLAAQVYRVDLFAGHGFTIWDEHWYGGHHLPGYSLLVPALGSLLGLRVLGAIAALAAILLFERLASAVYGPAARWGAAWFAVAAVGDLWIGRVAFAVGVALALAACLALQRRRPLLAGVLAATCAAASPVAGALLGLAALTLAIHERTPRTLVLLAAPPTALVLLLALLFPEGGWEPYPFGSFAASAVVALAFLWALPAGARLLGRGAIIYLAACLLCLLVRSPMGSNIERYGVLLAGPLLLCELSMRGRAGAPSTARWRPGRWRGGGTRTAAREGAHIAAAFALSVIGVWVLWGPVRETLAAGSDATSASYYAPVEQFMSTVAAAEGPSRLEVPLTRSHWEAALLAPNVSLARGWEKQLEERHDAVLLSSGLTAASYRAWLAREAVGYVALPDVALDPSSAREGRLIRRGLPYLRLVFAAQHWRIYRVQGALALLSGPGRLRALGHESFVVEVQRPGSFLVRVRYSRYLTVLGGSGCVARARGGWTALALRSVGRVTVAARFSLARAFGDTGCASAGGAGPAAQSAAVVPYVPPSGGAPFRWLVATSGLAPSIAAENRAPGTAAWRLPGPPRLIGGRAHGAVAGYVAEQAISPGQTQRVYVSAAGARTVLVELYRIGWYGGRGGRLVLQSAALPVVQQPPCAHSASTGLTECHWRATLSFAVPHSLPSGVYVAKLSASSGAQSDCMFVVRAARAAALLVQIPTATYEAYNAWGGNSLYPGKGPRVAATGSSRGVEVSFDRPYDSETGAGQFFIREVAIVRFLERYGYPVAYTTDASVGVRPDQVSGARALIDVGHSEYWSGPQAAAFQQARDRGTSLLFLSSDKLAWRVRYSPATAASSERGAPGHRVVSFKESAARDPDRAEPSGLFPHGGADLAGNAYGGCITPRLPVSGPPVYRYYAWRAAPALKPLWLFAGTGVTSATRIRGIVGYELDGRTPATPAETRLVGAGRVAACLRSSEPAGVSGTTAASTLYTARSGAIVFATGTLGWLYGLSPVPEASPDVPSSPDARVVAMTRNLLARVLGARVGSGSYSGASP